MTLRPHPQDPTINLHLFTLSTFQPHPRAKEHILTWPSGTLYGRAPSLGFQICDDGLLVLKNHHRGSKDMLCGWQWTTGRLAVTLIAPHTSTFESFICLTPSSFAIPSVSTTLNPDSEILGDLTDPSDLIFSHHLNIYAFPPLSSTTVNEHEPFPPPHTATHVTTIDLPEFVIDFENDLPPPRMTIRADPAPRYNLPIHPIGSPQPFIPDPESGIVVLEFYCQPTEDEEGHLQTTHYVLFVRKKTLLGYLPAPTSPLLFSAFPRPAPVVPFANIAPKVRMLGPHQYVPCKFNPNFTSITLTYVDPHFLIFSVGMLRLPRPICHQKRCRKRALHPVIRLRSYAGPSSSIRPRIERRSKCVRSDHRGS